MAESTGIGWCDATFNPWIGCEKVSPGCAHCYAETLVTGRMGRENAWGANGVRQRTSPSNWQKPLRWEKLAAEGRLPDGSPNEDGHRPRVFCASLADVFEPRPELEEWRQELFQHVIAATPSLDWLILTKRPAEARDWLNGLYDRSEDALFGGFGPKSWPPLRNVWVGTSIENSRHTWRADVLREVPAVVRFISAEPLLGSLFGGPTRAEIAATQTPAGGWSRAQLLAWGVQLPPPKGWRERLEERAALDLSGIDWVIVGGESGGRSARPMHPDWARELRDACLATQEEHDYLGPDSNDIDGERWGAPDPTAFFFKQWGSWGLGWSGMPRRERIGVQPDGRVITTDWDGSEIVCMEYRGAAPTSSGARLDGREWQEFPEPARVPVA